MLCHAHSSETEVGILSSPTVVLAVRMRSTVESIFVFREHVGRAFGVYRTVQILVDDLHGIYNVAFSTMIVTVTLFIITGVFGAIRVRGAVAGVLGCVAGCDILLVVLMLEILANVYSCSTKSVKKLVRYVADEYGNLRRVQKGHVKRLGRLRPIEIRVLAIYPILKVSVLIVAKILAENTAVLLITF